MYAWQVSVESLKVEGLKFSSSFTNEAGKNITKGLQIIVISGNCSLSNCSCACIFGQDDVECRAVEYEGERYESIPPELIARAALRGLGIET